MATAASVIQQKRTRGRPRLGDLRLEITVPKDVLTALVQQETATNTYRTQVAAGWLCDRASKELGYRVRLYH